MSQRKSVENKLGTRKETKDAVSNADTKSDATEIHVIGGGLMRTGTMSLKMALEIIYQKECLHMSTFWMNPQIINQWIDTFKIQKSKTDWKELLKNYCAAVDVPSIVFHRDLLEVFPNSKLIITVRDPYQWAKSIQMTIRKHMQFYNWRTRIVYYFKGLHRIPHLTECCINSTLGRNINWDDSDDLVRRYNSWVDKVISSVPKDRLLILNISDGWEPICKFLNVPQPTVPFPHVNDQVSFEKRFMEHKLEISTQWSIIRFVIFFIMILLIGLFYFLNA